MRYWLVIFTVLISTVGVASVYRYMDADYIRTSDHAYTSTVPRATGTLINTAPGTAGNCLISTGVDWGSSACPGGGGGSYVPVIQVKTGAYNPLSTDDEIIYTGTINSGTLPDCTGLSTNHIWNVLNVGGVVTLTASGSNTFKDGISSAATVYILNDPGASITLICNQGGVIYVRQ